MTAIGSVEPRAGHAPSGGQAAPARPAFGRGLLPPFFLALILPGAFTVAGLALSPMRLLLMAAFVPLLAWLATGKAGRLRAMDGFMILFSAWMVLSYLYNHGMERFPYAMITMVELSGSYLLGRVAIRSQADFRRLFRLALWLMIFLAPFVLVELLTGHKPLRTLARALMLSASEGGSDQRLGLTRVIAGFEHPILYGLFCSSTLAVLLAMAYGRPLRRLLTGGFVSFMTFASLSSAPLLALAIQIGLLVWGRLSGGRWWLLLGLCVAAYVAVDLLADSSPLVVFVSRVTFDPHNAWVRMAIWDYGSAEMWRHPVFGIGLHDWTRASWLPPSIDNFWLVIGVRHGAVGLGLLLLALASGLWAVARAKLADPGEQRLRRAYLITMVALGFTLTTVHVWGGTSCFVFLLFGAGQWFGDGSRPAAPQAPRAPEPEPAEAATPYSRFAPRPGPAAPR